jgi:hypothetical protein
VCLALNAVTAEYQPPAHGRSEVLVYVVQAERLRPQPLCGGGKPCTCCEIINPGRDRFPPGRSRPLPSLSSAQDTCNRRPASCDVVLGYPPVGASVEVVERRRARRHQRGRAAPRDRVDLDRSLITTVSRFPARSPEDPDRVQLVRLGVLVIPVPRDGREFPTPDPA